jgi:hypothetical protein
MQRAATALPWLAWLIINLSSVVSERLQRKRCIRTKVHNDWQLRISFNPTLIPFSAFSPRQRASDGKTGAGASGGIRGVSLYGRLKNPQNAFRGFVGKLKLPVVLVSRSERCSRSPDRISSRNLRLSYGRNP